VIGAGTVQCIGEALVTLSPADGLPLDTTQMLRVSTGAPSSTWPCTWPGSGWPRVSPGWSARIRGAGGCWPLAVRPGARIVPTGGIALADVPDWLRSGALAVGVGRELLTGPDLAAAVGNIA
jgi:hypothetical protein